VQHEQTRALLGADATEFSDGIAKEFYGKPNEDQGGYETWHGWQLGRTPSTSCSSSTTAMARSTRRPASRWSNCELRLSRARRPTPAAAWQAIAGQLSTSGRIFLEAGQPWRWKGVSAFKLCELFRQGRLGEIDAILADFAGYTVLRVWDYVTWPGTGWESPGADVWVAFLGYVRARGWRVEITLLTDDDPARIEPAIRLVGALAVAGVEALIEIGNEPRTHKQIRTSALVPVLETSRFLYTSGDYEDSRNWRGRYGVAHTARTPDYARRAHDLMEYFNGGGPNDPGEPACRAPWVADEPAKLQDVPGSIEDKVRGWRAYFGACSLLGAGATFHHEGGKFGQRPTDDDRRLATAALEGLNAFPADAPLGGYQRLDEPNAPESGRTYVIGGRYMVRCQQNGTAAPEAGWRALDDAGVLWTR
jgi:hypothetical protein